MKKTICALICFIMLISLFSCRSNESKEKEIIAMFDSFEKAQNSIILTCYELVIGETHYDLSSIQYEGKECKIVFLEETGFYSYTYDQDSMSVKMLFAEYVNFDAVLLGEMILPSKIIASFFGDNCFWFRVDDPAIDGFKQLYCSWNIETHQSLIQNTNEIDENYEHSMDGNRSKKYSFSYDSKLEITNRETNTTKTIDSSILNKFDEGKQIKEKQYGFSTFNISRVFEKDGDIYFVSYHGANASGSPCYYYVSKWNFETEECEFVTSICFEEYQEWIEDMYIK